MMESADVVRAIFRALGIDGWETIGMEPGDVIAARTRDDVAIELFESPRRCGIGCAKVRAATARHPAERSSERGMEIALEA